MHKIRNVSDTTQKFNARNEKGDLVIVRLAPGHTGDFDADVNQAVFARGLLKATALSSADAEAAASAAPAKAEPPAGHKPLKPRADA